MNVNKLATPPSWEGLAPTKVTSTLRVADAPGSAKRQSLADDLRTLLHAFGNKLLNPKVYVSFDKRRRIQRIE